jgi:hypothetical protein
MFDERRHRITAGIDKSYLLEPIVVETKTTTTKRVIAPNKPMRSEQKMSNYSKVIVPPLQNRLINHDINGNNHFSQSDDPLDRTFRETKISTRTTEKLNSTTNGIARKVTPAVSSPPALKNVTNQKVRMPLKSSRREKTSSQATIFPLSWLFSFVACKIFHSEFSAESTTSKKNPLPANLFLLSL